ncbi:Uncharacterized protein PBTT_00461 [Plasmodiophora brassicae]|uniref:Uncharacterized protein n=1 Tax=Plasmodiophora brassicae TaxID=37360 RepID=A0A0G4ILS0_PLABS|nr:hypothetical protein PBRA_004784 [Plasmodiophora brassicae]SPQ93362.1 unnamed protein product [Plasmodiophora brassicae]
MPNHFVPLPIYCIAGYTSSSSLQRQGGSGISFPNRSAKQCAMAASGGATPSSADLSTSDIFADLERLQPATAQDVAGALASDHGRGRDESLRARNFIQLSAYLSDTVRPALNDIRDRLAETLAALNAHRAEPLPGAEILSASSSSSPAFTINHEESLL